MHRTPTVRRLCVYGGLTGLVAISLYHYYINLNGGPISFGFTIACVFAMILGMASPAHGPRGDRVRSSDD